MDSLSYFIDNEEIDNGVCFYRRFNNFETDIEETLKAEYEQGLEDIGNFDEISNLCESSEDEPEIDNFNSSIKKVNNFNERLLPKSNSHEDNFIRVILYALRYEKEKKTDICNKNEFEKVTDEKLIEQLDENKYQFILDLQKFNNNCYEIYSFLSNRNYFLRVFELKNKFRHLTMKELLGKKIIRDISSCITEKYNGFQTISIEFARKEKKTFKPIDIIYKPAKNPEITPLCYFTQDISKTYINFYNVKDKTRRAHGCYECYYCRKILFKGSQTKKNLKIVQEFLGWFITLIQNI